MPRAPLSRRTKLGIAGVVAVLALVTAAILVVQHLRSTPGKGDLLTKLTTNVGTGKMTFDDATVTTTKLGEGRVRLVFRATGAVVEPLYEQGSLDRALLPELAAAETTLAEADRLLASPSGVQIRDWANLGVTPADPRQAMVLQETTRAGAQFTYEGEAIASRLPEGWQIELERGAFQGGQPLRGEPRKSFGTDVYVQTNPADLGQLKALLTARVEHAEKTLAAGRAWSAKLVEEARVAASSAVQKPQPVARPATKPTQPRLARGLRTGGTYDGTARNDSGEVVRLRLRILQADSATGTVKAVLESREQNGIYHPLGGTFDPATGIVALGTEGQGKHNATGRLRFPPFSYSGVYRVSLRFTETGLNGELEGESWVLEFPLGATGTALGKSP